MKFHELKIYTQNFSNQIDFYSKTIGLNLVEKSTTQALYKIGASQLRIVKSDKFQPYHFAINIPSNKENDALQWLKKRVEILKDNDNEIQDFDFWNAKAMYFYDADNNIVELIARKNLSNESDQDFTIDSLLEISEIGMPVGDIEAAYTALNNVTNIEIFDGGFERFCAIGNESGLIICINKKIKDWFPTGDKAESSEFSLKFEENGNKFELRFINEEITVAVYPTNQ